MIATAGWLGSLAGMDVKRTLRAASGWLELGLAEEAMVELVSLPPESRMKRSALELKLAAEIERNAWNAASDTARLLCLKSPKEPEFFLRAAYCLHETGDTLAARDWLLRGPKELLGMPVFHYNLACYLWTLGEQGRARGHLKRAIAMDETLMESAKVDSDLAGIGVEG